MSGMQEDPSNFSMGLVDSLESEDTKEPGKSEYTMEIQDRHQSQRFTGTLHYKYLLSSSSSSSPGEESQEQHDEADDNVSVATEEMLGIAFTSIVPRNEVTDAQRLAFNIRAFNYRKEDDSFPAPPSRSTQFSDNKYGQTIKMLKVVNGNNIKKKKKIMKEDKGNYQRVKNMETKEIHIPNGSIIEMLCRKPETVKPTQFGPRGTIILPMREMFDVLYSAHLRVGHRRVASTYKNLKKIIWNTTFQQSEAFVAVCPVCQSKARAGNTSSDLQACLTAPEKRQEMEHAQARATDKAAANKQKHTGEVILETMRTSQSELGSLPPGAKGTVGAGRRRHSTNLTHQPATYSHDNIAKEAQGNKDVVSVIDKTPPLKAKAKSSAATISGNSLAPLEKLGNSLQAGTTKLMGVDDDKDIVSAGGKRKRVIYEKQAALEKSILFYQKFPGNEKAQKAMDDAMEKHVDLSNELQHCLDEEE